MSQTSNTEHRITSNTVLHSEEGFQQVNNKRSDSALERQYYEFRIVLSRFSVDYPL